MPDASGPKAEKLQEIISAAIVPVASASGVISYRPETFESSRDFLPIYQGPPTNELQRVGKHSQAKTSLMGRGEINEGGLSLFIENYNNITDDLKPSAVKLFQAGILQITEQNSFRKTELDRVRHVAEFTLTKYMELRELRDRKEARRQVKEDCERLLALSMKWEEQRGKDVISFDLLKPVYRATLDLEGTITLAFAPEFAHYLANAYEMKLPSLYFRLSDKYNPNSSPLLYKIALQKHMNRGQRGEDIISVKKLLENAPSIPDYDSPSAKGKPTEKIIRPFERDLDALEPDLTWEYCNSKGTPLTPQQLENFSYAVFIECYVKITWKSYPLAEYAEARKELDVAKKNAVPKRRAKKRAPNKADARKGAQGDSGK